MTLPVQVYGTSANGLPFLQCAGTRNISSQGALFEGIAGELKLGTIVGVRCCDKEANFRVVWVRDMGGSPRTQEAGIQSLAPRNSIWSLVPAPLWTSGGDLLAKSDWARLVVSNIHYGTST